MNMEIDVARLDSFIERGALDQGGWGDGRERACLMSALVSGATSEADCAAKGWPLWLAEAAVWMFDSYPAGEAATRGRALAAAIAEAEARGVDWDEVRLRFRLDGVLPIALAAIGEGDEPWRAMCRAVVQESIDNGGRPADAARAAEAALAALAAGATWAAADAALAAGATWAAADAARAAARDRMEAVLLAAMRGAPD